MKYSDHLVDVDLNYTVVEADLKFQVSNFQREASNNLTIKYVTNSTKPFHSPYDGFIGISPDYSASTGQIEDSWFITDLKLKKMIDDPIVSIYTRNEFGNSSIIKFGGWDNKALVPGTTL